MYPELIMQAVKLIGSKKQDAEKQKQARMAAALGQMPNGQQQDDKQSAIGGILNNALGRNQLQSQQTPALSSKTTAALDSLGFDGDRSYEDDLSLL